MNNQNKQITVSNDEYNGRADLAYTPGITLNGKPAVIRGLRLKFGYVDNVEFAWETIEHVIKNKNGAFKS